MNRLRRTALVANLAACLFVLNVWLPAQVVGHATAHAHHSSATHADPLCTLLCSAGQAVHGVTVDLSSDGFPVARVDLLGTSQISPRLPRHQLSRGPPFC